MKDIGVILTSTIVGGELSLATGVALSLSMQESDAIVACFFGDGAACEGIFHESLNLASIWKLPVLHVCENNHWQAFVHRKETMLNDHISPMAASYGMESVTVDGNNVEAVHEAAKSAIAKIRETKKPFLLETYSYRTRGHFEPDDQKYVDPGELARWKAKDPILSYRKKLLSAGTFSAADLDAIQNGIKRDRQFHPFHPISPHGDGYREQRIICTGIQIMRLTA